ncbi:MAG: hypothetical protein QM820_55525 [Minicystis sp.]
MPTPNLCAYDAAGRVLVLCDGRQVLVHGGADEAPLWKRDLDADPVGFGAAGDAVITLDSAGKLAFWHITEGEPLTTIDVTPNPRALGVARQRALCAVVVADGVTLVERGVAPRTLKLGGATAAALNDDGTRLAMGNAAGEVQIVTASGDPVGKSQLDGAVTSLCWSAAGFWIATCGERVLRIEPAGGEFEHITRAGGMAPDCVSASLDGRLFAARLTENLMMALAYPSRETAVQLRYPTRKVTGVAFGPGHRLGVALDLGDGNFVDIPNEQLLRTDTFPGRTHNRWMVATLIKSQGTPAGATPAAAAGAPATAPLTASPATASKSSAGMWLGIIGALIGIAIVLSRCV